MTALEFMARKNAIIEKETGVTLIPEDQLEDVSRLPLVPADGNAGICPYCLVLDFLNTSSYDKCKGCPMAEKSNSCRDPHSTYVEVLYDLEKRGSSILLLDLPGMADLVEEYNSSFYPQGES